MRERPILFNGAMVRAILSGAKTQTRRAMKVQPVRNGRFWEAYGAGWTDGMSSVPAVPGHSLATNCPFGQSDDRLWVRENFADLRGTGIEHRPDPTGPMQRYAFAADTPAGSAGDSQRIDYGIKWRPSIHMPRGACRLVLGITGVHVERLQAISDSDAEAEGAIDWSMECPSRVGAGPRAAFRGLWNSTGGHWDANPWVWAISFKRIDA